LNKVISNIKGAGTINVMISIDSSPELSIAETTEGKTTTTSTGSVTTTTTEPIIVKVNGEESPLVLKETLPEIKGVIVVSSGASDVKIKLDIITAVTTALGIDSNKVEVFVGI
jgi:stage III sporulation protein AG